MRRSMRSEEENHDAALSPGWEEVYTQRWQQQIALLRAQDRSSTPVAVEVRVQRCTRTEWNRSPVSHALLYSLSHTHTERT
jgi:hypothetical protein